MRSARILLVADGLEAGPSVAVLEAALHVVRTCSPPTAAEQVEAFRPDLVIADVVDRELGAFTRTVQRIHSSYRPLVLSLLGPGMSATAALDGGADACLERPFEPHDLEVHVRALLRRVPWLAHVIYQVGDLIVDETSHVVVCDDEPLTLTGKEFGILLTLAREAGRVVSKRALLEQLWGFDASDENLVEAQVSGLRKRLPPAARAMLHTVRGTGYVLRADSRPSAVAGLLTT
jgi:DNA-binding response OmpR family regulator